MTVVVDVRRCRFLRTGRARFLVPYGWPVTSSSSDSRAQRAGAASTETQESDEDDGVVGRLQSWREGIRRRPLANMIYRTLVTIIGFLVVALGILLLPLPGPGWLIVFLGLGILATEYEWSRRLLTFAREKVTGWTHWLGRQPIVVRALFGLAMLAIVAGALWVTLWWYGVPSWVPDGLPIVQDIPERS